MVEAYPFQRHGPVSITIVLVYRWFALNTRARQSNRRRSEKTKEDRPAFSDHFGRVRQISLRSRGNKALVTGAYGYMEHRGCTVAPFCRSILFVSIVDVSYSHRYTVWPSYIGRTTNFSRVSAFLWQNLVYANDSEWLH